MTKIHYAVCAAALAAGWMLAAELGKVDSKSLLTGQSAFADAQSLKPGTFHKITSNDLPKPFDTRSTPNFPRVVARPADAWPQAPAGFKVECTPPGSTSRGRFAWRPMEISLSPKAAPERSKLFAAAIKTARPSRFPRLDGFEAAVRGDFLSGRAESAMAVRWEYQLGGALPVSQRRFASQWTG